MSLCAESADDGKCKGMLRQEYNEHLRKAKAAKTEMIDALQRANIDQNRSNLIWVSDIWRANVLLLTIVSTNINNPILPELFRLLRYIIRVVSDLEHQEVEGYYKLQTSDKYVQSGRTLRKNSSGYVYSSVENEGGRVHKTVNVF